MNDRPGDIAVRFDEVGRRARDGEGRHVELLQGVSFEVKRGRFCHVVGPSGSGKSTLLRLVNRLDEADEGRVEVLGCAVVDWPVADLRRAAAMVFQEPALLGMTVKANLQLGLAQSRRDQNGEAEAQIAEAMSLAGVDENWLDRTAERLSVGQKHRVALARALVAHPKVLLLDEPTSSLDPRGADQLLDHVKQLVEEEGVTVLNVSHRLERLRALGGDVAVLIDGRLAAFGEADAVFDDPPSDEVAAFLSGEDVDG